jgi:uncharacterized membrane protein
MAGVVAVGPLPVISGAASDEVLMGSDNNVNKNNAVKHQPCKFLLNTSSVVVVVVVVLFMLP